MVDAENTSKAVQLKARTKAFALRVMRRCRTLPHADEARVIRRELLRSATSVAANYRVTTRARSRQEFAAKMGSVVEEADESVFWIELLVEAELVEEERVADLMEEANQLVAIVAASHRTARQTKRPQAQSSDSSMIR